jgi:hypothetical protein
MSLTDAEPTIAPARPLATDRGVVVSAVLVFSILSLICAILSDGFVTADACTHYLYAKYAFADPINLVDVWARPFCTALYAIPALIGGRLGVRVCSLFVALACGWIAYQIARGQGLRHPALALLLTLGGPLFFVYSFSEMTELPFALLLGGAFLAYQNRKWFLAALLIGLTPTARPEGFGFVLLAGALLLFHRKWLPILLLPLPLLVWDLAGWILTARPVPWWRWLAHAWPWSEQSLYGRGNILTFAVALPIIVSPLVLPGTLLGIWRVVRRALHRADDDAPTDLHQRMCLLLTVAIPLFILIVHSLLRAVGKLGSFGEPRYLLIVAPFWGVLSAAGWEWVFDRLHWKRPLRLAAGAVLLPVVINMIRPAVPIPLSDDFRVAREFARHYHSDHLREAYPNVIASHPGIFYFLNENPTGAARRGGFTRGVIESPPAGTLLIWDPIYSERNANIEDATTLAAIACARWQPLGDFDRILNGTSARSDDASKWHVFRSLPDPRPGS